MTKYQQIINNLGGVNNISSCINCMTRLRISLKDESLFNQDKIKENPDVIAVIKAAEQIQIVFKIGIVEEYATELQKNINITNNHNQSNNSHNDTNNNINEHLDKVLPDKAPPESNTMKYDAVWETNKKVALRKYGLSVGVFFKKIANIFSPLIPALIAAGLLGGIANIIQNYDTVHQIPLPHYYYILRLINNAFMSYIVIFVGVNAANEFGATPILGGMVGAISLLPNIDANIKIILHIEGNIGGIFGLLFACYLLAKIEHLIRKIIPNSLTLLFAPTLSMLITCLILIYGIMPIDHILSQGILHGINALIAFNPLFAGYMISALFLPLVMLGIHQALMPIYFTQIALVGYTNIYPIMAMGGAGGIGAALAIYLRVKDNDNAVRKTILSVLPIALLGVGEPLIYGVTLPLGLPFITSCLGAGFGGLWIAYTKVTSLAIGTSGLALIPLISGNYLDYVIGLLIAYLGGFIITYFFGIKLKQNNAD
jgi:PTS system sucrose-specific IIC component